MKICRTINELQQWRNTITQTIGFVPTMGALHQGHLSLMQAAQKQCDLVVVSIFVNPTQFLQGEDLDAYPIQEAKDIEVCKRLGVDCLFLPTTSEIYQKDEPSICAPNIRGFTLEGAIRPGHFDGVLLVVNKLFNLVQPQKAFFGKKDAQQLSLITLMVKRFFIPIEIVALETVREKDGLALSSRNIYLSANERTQALTISKSLREAASMVIAKELDTKTIEVSMRALLTHIEVQYIAFLDRDFNFIPTIQPQNTIIAIACKVGTTRLIDNIWI